MGSAEASSAQKKRLPLFSSSRAIERSACEVPVRPMKPPLPLTVTRGVCTSMKAISKNEVVASSSRAIERSACEVPVRPMKPPLPLTVTRGVCTSMKAISKNEVVAG